MTVVSRKTQAEREGEAAQDYADSIRDGFNRDWSAYNAILLGQFSRTGFSRIKRRAWQIVEERQALAADPDVWEQPCPTCHSPVIRDQRGSNVVYQPARSVPVSEGLRRDVMADVLTEAHLRRDGHCGETHYPEADFVIARYAARAALAERGTE